MALDECFFAPPEEFETVHHSQQWYFEILRCKRHGNLFLRDVKGGIAMYERFIFVGQDPDSSYEDIWRRFHWLSDDELNWQGIAR